MYFRPQSVLTLVINSHESVIAEMWEIISELSAVLERAKTFATAYKIILKQHDKSKGHRILKNSEGPVAAAPE